jgi:hypothetical protein
VEYGAVIVAVADILLEIRAALGGLLVIEFDHDIALVRL